MNENASTGKQNNIQSRGWQLFKRLSGFVLAFVLFTGFFGLGTWQVYRLDYKLALIDRVESRVNAAPVIAPEAKEWSSISREGDEYRSIRLEGEFLPQYTTRVQATTVLGAGHWLLTPLRTLKGEIVWVNRGYIPVNQPDPMSTDNTQGAFEVTGLLRLTEPGGAFLRKNDPSRNRWHSRDIAALSEHHQLTPAAPYFVDAGKPRNLSAEMTAFTPESYPVDGLTVIKFSNSHLVYAITWYALALMVAGITFWLNKK